MKKAGDHIEMTVLREILQSSEEDSTTNESNTNKEGEKYSTIIHRDDKQGGQFGFSIAGGHSTAPSSNEKDNFYITKVNTQEKIQPLAIGDRVLSINGHDTANISHDQAVDMINNGGNNIEMTLYREKFTNGNSKTIVDNTVEVSDAV